MMILKHDGRVRNSTTRRPNARFLPGQPCLGLPHWHWSMRHSFRERTPFRRKFKRASRCRGLPLCSSFALTPVVSPTKRRSRLVLDLAQASINQAALHATKPRSVDGARRVSPTSVTTPVASSIFLSRSAAPCFSAMRSRLRARNAFRLRRSQTMYVIASHRACLPSVLLKRFRILRSSRLRMPTMQMETVSRVARIWSCRLKIRQARCVLAALVGRHRLRRSVVFLATPRAMRWASQMP